MLNTAHCPMLINSVDGLGYSVFLSYSETHTHALEIRFLCDGGTVKDRNPQAEPGPNETDVLLRHLGVWPVKQQSIKFGEVGDSVLCSNI